MAQPTALYTVAQVRGFDLHAMQVQGIPGYTLMQRAGAAAWRELRAHWPEAQRVVIVCGAGNNGGDGFVVARLAAQSGCEVTVLALTDVNELAGDARSAAADFVAQGGQIQPWQPALLQNAEVIVDAILGTGARPPLRGVQAAAIAAVNAAGRPVLALDLPSGLDGDCGSTLGDAIRADHTVCFVALKQGLFLGAGPELAGSVTLDDLGVAIPPGAASQPVLTRLSTADIRLALPPRRRDSHKGDFGRVLIIGGGPGMPGAVLLAGEACLRVGAGVVTVVTVPEHVTAIVAGRPELICIAATAPQQISALLTNATVIAIGPGLGRSPWAVAMLEAALAANAPLIVDADALNLLAERALALPPRAVVTPHPGEAARLLGCDSAEIQRDRSAALHRLVAKTGACVVLKGAGTLIGATGEVAALCEAGNPGMAAAGMGDVLTGTIAGIYAQCGDPWRAARAGVLLHSQAGDAVAAVNGSRGLLALDVAAALTQRMRVALA